MPAVNLSPVFQSWQGFTAGGLPLAGGFINTYIAGTSTPQATYTTSAGTITNSNPIQLGPDGRPPSEIWLVAGVAYKFILTDSLGLNPLSYDNIAGIGDIINLNVAGNTVLGGIGGTLNVGAGALIVNASGNTAVGGNLTVANNTTLGDASTDLVTVNANTVAWPNNPTHSGNHTFSGSVNIAQPGFSAYITTAFNVGQSNTPIAVIYPLADFNTGTCYATGTGIFTAPKAGKYVVTFGLTPQFAAGSAAGTILDAVLFLNGSPLGNRADIYAVKTIAGAVTQIGPSMQFSLLMNLTAGNTLQVKATYSDAVSILCSAINTSFSVIMVA